MSCPKIEFEGKEYYQIACKKCSGIAWMVYTHKGRFIAKCLTCGHIIEIKFSNCQDRPDPKPTELRFFE